MGLKEHTLFKTRLVIVFVSMVLGGLTFTKVFGQSTSYQNIDNQKVLFIGNSYTAANNLPNVVSQMATSVGKTLTYNSHTPGGARFEDHANSATVTGKINSDNWDYVVLQGQSQEVSYWFNEPVHYLHNEVSNLTNKIRSNNVCSVPLMFMTWGRKNGDAAGCNAGNWFACSYETMDTQIRKGYESLARTNQADISPVSVVWRYIRNNHPEIELYSGDGSHPSYAGTYAAAVAFYTLIFRNDPTAITFNGSLAATDAAKIRNAAKIEIYDIMMPWVFSDASFDYNYDLLSVDFNSDKNTGATLQWDFGDGGNSTEENPTHVYAAAGEFDVILKKTFCNNIVNVLYTVTVSDTYQPGESCDNAIDFSDPEVFFLDSIFQVNTTNYNGWYKYKIPANGKIRVSTCELSNKDTFIKLYKETCDNLISSSDDDCWIASNIVLDVMKDETYLIEFDNVNYQGLFNASLTFTEPKEGDSCNDPITIVEGENEVNQVIDPQWYTFTPTVDGQIVVSTCETLTATMEVDLGIALYDACGGTLLGGAYDDCPTNDNYEYLAYTVTAGNTYLLNFENYIMRGPEFNFDFQYVPIIVEGSTCDFPIVMETMGTYDVDNAVGDQWFSFTATQTANLTITTCDLNNNKVTAIEVFADDCTTQLAISNDGCGTGMAIVEMGVAEGTDYRIKMAADNTNGQYQVSVFYPDDLPGQNKADAQPIDQGTHTTRLNFINEEWFVFTMPDDGTVTVSSCGIDPGTNHVLELEANNMENVNYSCVDGAATAKTGAETLALTPTLEGTYRGFVEEEVYIKWHNDNSHDFEVTFEACPADRVEIDRSACESYEFNGELLTATGLYEGLFINQAGCDSLVTLNLTIRTDVYADVVEGTYLANEGGYDVGENDYFRFTAPYQGTITISYNGGTPGVRMSVEDGCSGDYYYKPVTYKNEDLQQFEANEGDQFNVLLEHTYTEYEYIIEFTFEGDCDNIGDVTEITCDSYNFNGNILTTTGTYQEIFSNQHGCDSLVTLNLTILESTNSSTVESACDSFDFFGEYLTLSGIYQQTITNTAGCDSLVTLNLTILESTGRTITETTCDNYDFFGTNLTSSGTYFETLTNSVGCDSLVTLNLTILESTSSTINESACDSFEFDGEILSSTGSYNYTLVNSVGCDSLVTLNLTILESSGSTLNEIACDSFDFNGEVLTVSGVYNHTLTNMVGCDSLVTLNLTVLENSSSTIEESACTGYEFFGNTLLESGTYQEILTNTMGCDSLVTLHLTILDETNASCIDQVTSIENEIYIQPSIYPNPNQGLINIDLGAVRQKVKIQIYTSMGVLVEELHFNNTSHVRTEINGEPGIYYLSIKTDNYGDTFKITKR